MPTTITVNTQLLQQAPAQRVYIRRRWNSDWVLQPNLYCRAIRHALAPGNSLAILHWVYGQAMHPSDGSMQSYPPLELLGWFVKIEYDVDTPNGTLTKYHYGYVTEEDRERRGEYPAVDSLAYSGQQNILAFGLEYLYRRQRIDRSRIHKLDGSEATIRLGLTFNAENPFDRETGNRSTGIGSDGHYLFEEDLENALNWSTRDIVQYLHSVFRPVGSSDFDFMDWQLDSPYMSVLPSSDRPRVIVDGRTLGDVFDELMNRRRGLGWSVFIEEDAFGSHPFIRPISLSSTPVDMPDGWTLEEAHDQYDLYTDSAVQARSPIIRRSLSAQYDQVRVVGERIRSIFTVSRADATLDPDWTSAQRTEYNDGASGLGDYPTDVAEREAANARVRTRQDLERVYSSFKLTDDFSFVSDGIGGTDVIWLPNETADGPEPVYRPEVRLLHYLPIDEHAVSTEARQYLRPFVLVRVHEAEDEFDSDKYVPIDRISQYAKIEETGDGGGFRWSASVRVAEHDAALWVNISGKPQHVIAGDAANDFVALGDGEDERDLPELDWRMDMLATVCVEAQRYTEAVWPASSTITDSDSVRRLIIDIGEQGRLDYIPQGTVTGLEDDGKLIHQTGSVYIRDDRSKMESLAKQAYIWYQRVRQAVQIPFAGCFVDLVPGNFISTFGSVLDAEPINAVVSQVEYDFENGTTLLQTDYAELDFRRVV